MNTLVLEHVPVSELPEKWRAQLSGAGSTTVTVTIEPEARISTELADDPLFGMWSDRSDLSDVAGYVRDIRRSRFEEEGGSDRPASCPTC